MNGGLLRETARHFLMRVSYLCFRHKAKRGARVAGVVAFGWGSSGEHPHLHMSLAAPKDFTWDAFAQVLEKAANKTRWIHRERCIRPYTDMGWSKYLIDHGSDDLMFSLPNPSAKRN